MAGKPDVDDISGVETTGHEWDGIKELNNPLPRWWLYTLYATIVWAVVYMVFMPAIPLFNSFTPGVLQWSSRESLDESMQEAAAEQKPYLERISADNLQQISEDAQLMPFVMAGGSSAYAVNCSQCHGSGAEGGWGYPNLNDDAWIWGGSLDEIYHTIKYGIRNANLDSRQNVMAAYGRDGILSRAEINEVAEYVLSLSGRSTDPEAVTKGQAIYEEQCVACHEASGVGNTDLGAPSLADAIWLYGGDKASIVDSLINGRAGMMPGWGDRLSDDTIKILAVYIHSLGGGK
ncbi:MAG: cytochrome-c oxidase, cbb3-type subunit III [Pseudomonadota bacterium]